MQEARKWRWLVAPLLLVALLGAACGGGEEPTEPAGGGEEAPEFPEGSTMAKLVDKGEITVGVKYDVPLFGFKNPQSG